MGHIDYDRMKKNKETVETRERWLQKHVKAEEERSCDVAYYKHEDTSHTKNTTCKHKYQTTENYGSSFFSSIFHLALSKFLPLCVFLPHKHTHSLTLRTFYSSTINSTLKINSFKVNLWNVWRCGATMPNQFWE